MILRYKKTWRKVKYILQSEWGQYEKAIRVWFQLYDILEKEKYGDSKNICGSWCWGQRREDFQGSKNTLYDIIIMDIFTCICIHLSKPLGCSMPKVNSRVNYQLRAIEVGQCTVITSVAHLYPTVCNPINCSTPGLAVHHQLLEFTHTHVHWVSDDIQPSHSLSPTSPPAFNLCQHQGHFKWVSPSHQLAKVLEFQLQHQSFQRRFRTDFI